MESAAGPPDAMWGELTMHSNGPKRTRAEDQIVWNVRDRINDVHHFAPLCDFASN